MCSMFVCLLASLNNVKSGKMFSLVKSVKITISETPDGNRAKR